jgi:hypothetical protein
LAKIPRIASHHQIAAPSVSRNRCLAGNEIRRESKYGGLKGLGFIDSKCKRETGELAACRQRKRQMTRRKGWKKNQRTGRDRNPETTTQQSTVHYASSLIVASRPPFKRGRIQNTHTRDAWQLQSSENGGKQTAKRVSNKEAFSSCKAVPNATRTPTRQTPTPTRRHAPTHTHHHTTNQQEFLI